MFIYLKKAFCFITIRFILGAQFQNSLQMSKTFMQEIQSISGLYQKNQNRNKQRSLLDQALPRYRQQIFQRNLSIGSREKSYKVREKYKNFGEEDFIKKLKYNSTKQIDRKSINAIDKYLKEMSQQKIQPMGYLSQVGSLKGWSVFDERSVYENEQSYQPEFQRLTKNQSLPYIPTKLKSQEMVEAKFMQKIELKNHSNAMKDHENIQNLNAQQNTVRQSANFTQLHEQSRNFKNNCAQREQNNIEAISFRKNLPLNQKEKQQQKVQALQEQFKQMEKKLNSSKQGSFVQQASQNNFYHKFSLPPHHKIETQHQSPKQSLKSSKRLLKNDDKKSYQELQYDYETLIQKNIEQQEIIKLQQVMIDKLNFQLQNLTKIMKQNSNKQKSKQEQIIQPKIVVNNQSQNLLRKIQQTQAFNRQLCQNSREILNTQIESYDQEWNQNFMRLKSLLTEVENNLNPQSINLVSNKRDNGILFSFNDYDQVTDSLELKNKQSLEYFQRRNQFYYPQAYRSPQHKNQSKIQVQMVSSNIKDSKGKNLSELSNFYSSQSLKAERQLEYSAGTENDSPFNKNCYNQNQ